MDTSDRQQSDSGDGLYASEAEYKRAIRYSRTREWLVLVGGVWSALLNVVALTTGLSAWMRDRATGVAPRRLGPAIPYAVGSTILSFVVSLPLSYFRGYVVEQRYGLSNQTRRAWMVDELKELGIGLALTAPLIQGVYWLIRRWPARWWAIVSALTVPLSAVLANLAPVLLMPLFNKFEPLPDRALAQRVTDLAAREGVHVSDVLQMDMSRQTKKANAAFTGLGNTKRIIIGDTLLQEFTPDEVEVVLAHELGHQVHNDIWKLIALGAPTSLVSLAAAHFLNPPVLRRFGKRWRIAAEDGARDVAALPLLMLLGQSTLLAVVPALNALSRNLVEHPADRYALNLTGKRDAFIGAMQKLGRMNLSDPHPPALVKLLLYSHPPLQERIDFARTYPVEGSRPVD